MAGVRHGVREIRPHAVSRSKPSSGYTANPAIGRMRCSAWSARMSRRMGLTSSRRTLQSPALAKGAAAGVVQGRRNQPRHRRFRWYDPSSPCFRLSLLRCGQGSRLCFALWRSGRRAAPVVVAAELRGGAGPTRSGPAGALRRRRPKPRSVTSERRGEPAERTPGGTARSPPAQYLLIGRARPPASGQAGQGGPAQHGQRAAGPAQAGVARRGDGLHVRRPRPAGQGAVLDVRRCKAR